MHYTITNKMSQQSFLHFKQWSNKGYAVFCSLGKVVHIGSLAVSVTQWIGDLIDQVEEQINLSVEHSEEEVSEELLEQELLQLLPVVNAINEYEISIFYRLKLLTTVNWRSSLVNGFFVRYDKAN